MSSFVFEKSKESNVMKTVRFPEDVYNDIEKIVNDANNGKSKREYSFNGFIVSACRYALDNMKK